MIERRVARDIAGMAFGKALFALSPVVAALGPDQREVVFRYLADEYVGFDKSIQRLAEASDARRESTNAGAGDEVAAG